MKCVICRFGETHHGRKTITLNKTPFTLVVEDVPGEVCDACGEAYLEPDVTGRLQEMFNKFQSAGVLLRRLRYDDDDLIYAPKKQRGEHRKRRAEEFISKLELTPKQICKRPSSNGYDLYASLDGRRVRKFGFVRLNIAGQDPGKMMVYAVKDFDDPRNRFICQPKNPKHCWYKFWPDDDEAMTYAVSVVKSAYESKL